MHNNEFTRFLRILFNVIGTVLPFFFWLGLIFAFEDLSIAFVTLIAALIHEIGHFLVLILKSRSAPRLRSVLSGFRMKGELVSYDDELLLYLGGPLANFLAAIFGLAILPKSYAITFAAVNLATCFSNLLPAEGYDGFGIICCYFKKRGLTHLTHSFLEWLSFSVSVLFTVFSLYLMNKIGEGYWIFFVFFVSAVKKMEKSFKNVKNEKNEK